MSVKVSVLAIPLTLTLGLVACSPNNSSTQSAAPAGQAQPANSAQTPPAAGQQPVSPQPLAPPPAAPDAGAPASTASQPAVPVEKSTPAAAPATASSGTPAAASTATPASTPSSATPPPATSATPTKPTAMDKSAAGSAPAASSAASAASAASAKKAAPPEPEFRELTIPSGTALSVRLTTPVASNTSKVEDEVRGTLTRALVVSGVTVVPAGAEVAGTVRDAKQSGRVKGKASLSFRFERLIAQGESHRISTATIAREAAVNRRKDVEKGAIGGAAGAIIGGIVGGGKGAAIGAGVGGAGAVVATRGEEVKLPAGTTVRTTLQQPLTVLVPRRD